MCRGKEKMTKITCKIKTIFKAKAITVRRVARIFVRGGTTIEGPKVPSEARRREAPKR